MLGTILFAPAVLVLEFFPALEPDRYFVRQLNIETGEVREVYSPNVELAPEMRGKARAQALAPDFLYMYTLYTLEPDADPLTDPTASRATDRWAFIHVLSLEKDWSFCIFLPVPIGTTDRVELSMTISPDGDHVYVVDRATSTIAVIDTRTFEVTRTANSDWLDRPGLDAESNNPSSTVAANGNLYTATSAGLLSFGADLSTPEQVWHPQQSTIVDLQAASDANQLRIALADGRIIIYDLDRDEEIMTLTAPGDGAGFVGPRGSAVALSEGSIECAC